MGGIVHILFFDINNIKKKLEMNMNVTMVKWNKKKS